MTAQYKNLKKIIALIFIIEGLLFYTLYEPKIIEERINNLSFFIDKNDAQLLQNNYLDQLANLSLVDNISIKLNKLKTKISFTLIKESNASLEFLNNLINENHKKMSFAGMSSSFNIDAKSSYIIFIIFIFIPVFIIWFLIVKPKETKITTIHILTVFKYLFFLLLLGYMINYISNLFFNASLEEDPQNLKLFIQKDTIIAFLFIVIIAPVVEEFLFRGLLFRYFIEKNKIILGIIIINLEFILAHFAYFLLDTSESTQILLAIGILVMSTSLCWLYYKFNNIAVPIAFHSIHNLIAFVILVQG